MPTTTKSLEQWLQECPDKLAFYSRFIDVKEDVIDNIKDYELGGEGKLENWNDATINDITSSVILDTDWRDYNTKISNLVEEYATKCIEPFIPNFHD